jgi:endonuclease-8
VPEGDTIYRAARALGQALEGKVVTRFETALAPLASVDDNAHVAGRTVEKVESRGKWLLIRFSGDLILVTHMRMSGSWHIYRAGEGWHRSRKEMRVVITTAEFAAVAFNVPVAKFYTARTLARNSQITKLGSDLLGAEFVVDEAKARLLAHGDEEIANVLLNQRVMAGLGNVYKSEVLFACSVHPFRLVSALTVAEIDCILDRAQRFLEANVKDGAEGGMVTYTGLRRTMRKAGLYAADPGARLWVYRRQAKECRRCGATILMRRQGPGARSTYWCPVCQPELAR